MDDRNREKDRMTALTPGGRGQKGDFLLNS